MRNGAKLLVKGLAFGPTVAHCGDCKGNGFALAKGPRAARKCQRCKGNGVTFAGNTKR